MYCRYLSLTAARCSDSFREGLMYSRSADNDILYLEGAIVTFTCPPGQVLNGRNTSTCTGNGEWEPDPREAECIGESDIIMWRYLGVERDRTATCLCIIHKSHTCLWFS